MDNKERGRKDKKNESRRKKRASVGKKNRIREIPDSDSAEEAMPIKKPKRLNKKVQNVSGPQSGSKESDVPTKQFTSTENTGTDQFEEQQRNINYQATEMLADVERASTESVIEENLEHDIVAEPVSAELQDQMLLIEKEASGMLSELERENMPQSIQPDVSWRKRILSINDQWNQCREGYKNSRIERECPVFHTCEDCFKIGLDQYAISCKSCKKELCGSCDSRIHANFPFHARTLSKRLDMSSTHLLPVETVEHIGDDIEITVKDVPVPCYVPKLCPSCFNSGTLSLLPGSNKKIVITLQGRFDLNSAAIQCSLSECQYFRELSEEEYVSSHWWPGTPSGSMYLFAEEVLNFWFHLKHQNLGSSERKFLETLNRLSKENSRVDVINRTLFSKASREYEFFVHEVDRDVRKQKKAVCPTCGDNPSAACIDGNFRLPRLESASKGYGESLMKNEIIAADAEVNAHIKRINEEIATKERKSNPCGANVFKAAKDSSSSKKNLDETGLIMACCRHLIILQAVNMFVGETYRHAHYLHNFLYKNGYRIFCYDIVCLYWKWAEKVGEKLKVFSSLTKKMTAFLARFHAIAHVWHCYILWVGHWKKGVGATVGEEQEQVNASMSLYGNKTKHMTPENRNDTLSAGMMYLNKERFDRMPEFLTNRLVRSRFLAEAFSLELQELMVKRRLTESDLPNILKKLKKKATTCSEKNDDGPGPPCSLMSDLEGTYAEIQILKKKREKSANTAKERSKLNRIIGVSKTKAAKLIEKINEWQHLQETNSEGDQNDLITWEDFTNGLFPWQLSESKDSYRDDMYLVETWMLSQRHQEEIEIVEREMVTFLKSTGRVIDELENERDGYLEELNEKRIEASSVYCRAIMAKSFIIFEEVKKLRKLRLRACHAFQDDLFYNESDSSDDDLC